MRKLRIGTTRGLARGDREWDLNDAQHPPVCVEKTGIASILESALSPEIPNSPIRNFRIALRWGHARASAEQRGWRSAAPS
jgi:hypothetical protein